MKIRSILGALVIAALPFTSVWAENMTPEDIKKLVDEAVTKRLQERERVKGPESVESRLHRPSNIPCRSAPCRTLRWNVLARKSAPLVRRHWFRAIGLCQAVRVSPESHRRRLYGYSVSIPTDGQYRSR